MIWFVTAIRGRYMSKAGDEWKDDFKLEGVTYRKLYDEFLNGMHQNLTTALWLTHVAEINTQDEQ